jgi:hypothetical protein
MQPLKGGREQGKEGLLSEKILQGRRGEGVNVGMGVFSVCGTVELFPLCTQ